MNGKHWRIRAHDPHRIAHLAQGAKVPAVVAQLLLSRGIEDPAAAVAFLDARLSGLRDPECLAGTAQAAARLYRAVQQGERIVVYGDYDVDGMAATAILYKCLKLLGANVGYYIPSRLEEGYGLNHEALKTLAQRQAQVVVTVDCGIASATEAQTARSLGLELIISDHHALGETLPEAAAVVHPALPGCEYPFAGLSGSGVAFKLAWAICQQASQAKRVGQPMREFLLDAVTLAALGTVADVVPLVDENRILVRHGLSALGGRPGPGLEALLRVAGLEERRQRLTGSDVAFFLAPRLNAAGRLGQAQLAVELLLTDSADRARSLAEYVNELNNSRQSLEQSIYLSALKEVERQCDPQRDAALVLAGRNWHQGVLGIVANRLVDKFHRPVVLIALDELGARPGTGSARSIPGFDLGAALAACKQRLVSHGGHAAAAGLRIEEAQLEAFRAEFCEYAATALSGNHTGAELTVDAEAPLGMFTPDIMKQIARLEPFGHGNPPPMVCACGVRLVGEPRRMGGGRRHLQMMLAQDNVRLRAVAFGGGDWADELVQTDGSLEVAFVPVINEFRGRRSVELHVQDWRIAPQVASSS